MRKAIAFVSAGLIVLLLAIVGITFLGLQPHQQTDHQEFCFAEWCIAPAGLTVGTASAVVRVVIRSQAMSATQRPDHPQAWLVDPHGRMAGGPQEQLDVAVGPGQEYSADLTFQVTLGSCATFLAAEGAWPSFLGLGYAPSPFGERASWRLCEST